MTHKPQPGSYAAATAQGAEDFKKLEELFSRTKKFSDLTEADLAFLRALQARVPANIRPILRQLLEGQYGKNF